MQTFLGLIPYIVTGGFLKGYRTYIMAAVALGGVVAKYMVGDVDLMTAVPLAAVALGLGSLAAKVDSATPPAPPAQ